MYQSKRFIKANLNAHSWLGLVFGIVLYTLSLTGTLIVFSDEFERWEQPNIAEFEQFNATAMQDALEQVWQKIDSAPETLWLILPTKTMPRAHISDGSNEWYIDEHGKLLEQPDTPWLTMLKDLHYYLHLPKTFGIIIVGILGIFLLAISLSGVFSHPNIIRDAFKLRKGKSEHLEKVDLHNRLGVWGLPFTIMIALTGAFIGLVSIIVVVAAPIFYDGDREAIINAVYGADPSFKQQAPGYDIEQALQSLNTTAPDVTPLYIALQKPKTENAFIEIAASVPQRLIYSEIYRFNTKGQYYNSQALSDGPAGRQIAYSVYRLHFGAFGGIPIKLLYMLFGFALCYVCVSGLSIWFAKQKHETRLNMIWIALLWGIPSSITNSALLSLLDNTLNAFWVFWLTLLSSVASAFLWNKIQWYKEVNNVAFGSLLVILTVCYVTKYSTSLDMNNVTITSVLLLLGLYCLSKSTVFRKRPVDLHKPLLKNS